MQRQQLQRQIFWIEMVELEQKTNVRFNDDDETPSGANVKTIASSVPK